MATRAAMDASNITLHIYNITVSTLFQSVQCKKVSSVRLLPMLYAWLKRRKITMRLLNFDLVMQDARPTRHLHCYHHDQSKCFAGETECRLHSETPLLGFETDVVGFLALS